MQNNKKNNKRYSNIVTWNHKTENNKSSINKAKEKTIQSIMILSRVHWNKQDANNRGIDMEEDSILELEKVQNQQ